MPRVNLEETVLYIDIGTDTNSDIIRWVQPGSSVFRLDIQSARAIAAEYYQRLEKSNTRSVFIKKETLVYLILS